VWDVGCGVWNLYLRFRVYSLWFGVRSLECGDSDFGFRIWGLGIRVRD
jgi:hypothetical protein